VRSTTTSAKSVSPADQRDRWEAILVGAVFVVELLPGLRAKLTFASDVLLNQVVWSCIYVFAAVRIMQLWPRAKVLAPRTLLLVAFCLLMLASTMWSVAPTRTLFNAIELLGSALVGFYLVVRFSLSTFLRILLFKFAVVAAGSYAMILLAPGRGRDDWGSGPWDGVFPEKNGLGAESALALLTLLAMWPGDAKRRVYAIIGVVAYAVLLAGAKSATALSAFLGSLAVTLVILVCRSKKTPEIVRYLVLGGVVVSALAVAVFNITPSTILGMLGRSTSLTGRTDFWPYLWQAISDRPALGYGYSAFFGSDAGNQYLSTYVLEMSGGWYPWHAHDSFLQIALAGGFVAIGLFGVLLVVTLFRALRYSLSDGELATVWPLSVLMYLIFASYTESMFAMANTDPWVLFVVTTLYPIDGRRVVERVTTFIPRTQPWSRARGGVRP